MCRVFCATRFLNTIVQLKKLVSKTYKAKLSTADALACWWQNHFSCCCAETLQWFWTELGTPQRIEVQKVSWINVYFQSIWLSVVGKLHLTLTFSGKTVCIWSSKGNQSHCLHKMKENIYCPKHFYVFIPLETYLESFNEPREQVTCSGFTLIFWLASEIITAFILFYENACKIHFRNPIVQRTTQFKTFGLIINHA